MNARAWLAVAILVAAGGGVVLLTDSGDGPESVAVRADPERVGAAPDGPDEGDALAPPEVSEVARSEPAVDEPPPSSPGDGADAPEPAPPEPVPAVAGPGFAIHGLVVDRETGVPVPNARVTAYEPSGYRGDGAGRHEATADESGRFALPGQFANGKVFFSAEADDFVTRSPFPSVRIDGADVFELRVRVSRTHALRVQLLDSNHRPVAGTVELRVGRRLLCCFETDADGRLVLGDVVGRLGLSAGTDGTKIQVWAQSPFHRAGFAEIDAVELEKEEFVEIRLGRGAAVLGRVLDPSGAPIPHVRVIAYPERERGRTLGREAISDERGAFRIGGLAPGPHRVEPEPRLGNRVPNVRSLALVLDVVNDAVGIEFIYGTGLAIAGRAQNQRDESPLIDWLVTLHHPEWREPRTTLTDDAGRFEFAVPDGRYTVALRGRGWSDPRPPVVHEAVAAGSRDVRLIADVEPADGRIDLALHDAEDGRAIRGSVVIGLRWTAFGVPQEDRFPAELDASGSLVLGDMERTTYRVEIAAPGYAVEQFDVPLLPPRFEAWKRVAARRPVLVRGRVTDETGRPLEGAQVRVFDQFEPGRLVGGTSSTTDSLGRFEVPDAPPSATHVAALAAGHAASAVAIAGRAGAFPDVPIVLGRGTTLQGTASYADGSASAAVVLELKAAVATRYATTDPDGRFTFENVEDGPFSLLLPDGIELGDGEIRDGQPLVVDVTL